MPILDGISVTTYCQETAKHIEKLNIPGILTRDQMTEPPTEIDTSWRIQRLVSFMEHSVFCQNDRCCMYFCYSFKRIITHYRNCYHLDCQECHRVNVLLWDHVKKCKYGGGICRIPGCQSVMRTIGWDRLMAAQEPDHFKPENTPDQENF